MTTLSPYLNFNGNSKEAMEFYHGILGGNLEIQTFGDSNVPHEPEQKDQVIHASLTNAVMNVMASDTMPGQPVTFGNNVHLSFMGSDKATLTDYFTKLAEGGTIDMPLEKQFWGDIYGMLTDKFGVHWTVNISSEQE